MVGFFCRGKRLGWQRLEQFEAAAVVTAAREKIRADTRAKWPTPRAALGLLKRIRAKVRPIEKN
ncbi:hypothetical protein [Paraburkholderia sp. BL18I3N2]|uniref:hypothetical protein n=1 Tax=Paraburkholderia sp. BL18I3N2 TaxID=1938799 RepID=UPI0015E6866E|nr:hypothetical protein [Paraburkholderia sp. BL18I3N2]